MSSKKKSVILLIVVAALGYFVDIYDLIVFNVVKYDSFSALGFSEEQVKNYEITLFQIQMIGMLLGGLLWGIWGDKRGRVSVLFGSILMYSIANIANAFVSGFYDYAIWRFIAGIGLAGELGAGITLVAETMEKEKRGIGTMIIVTLGALGAVVAYFIGSIGWKAAYISGGVMGLLLLFLRAQTFESGMFEGLKESSAKRGDFRILLTNWKNFIKYLNCILIGVPIWFMIGILIALSARFYNYHEQGITDNMLVGRGIMWAYIGLSIGDFLSGLLSQLFRSRKKVILLYLFTSTALIYVFLFYRSVSYNTYQLMCFSLGCASGYWALFVTNASEQFGTNIRSTVTTTVPNFVRGSVVLIMWGFKTLSASFNAVNAASIVGAICLLLAFVSWMMTEETFSKDLNYVDEIS